jgi:DNA-directed RNA polymerase specialized sigma24 family protein
MSRTSPPYLRHANRSNDHDVTALLTRVAQADRAAFASLHRRLRPDLATQLASVPLDQADAAAVVDATFVEIWWLARRRTGRATDALAWVRGIAARRAADRWVARMTQPTDGQPMGVLTMFDRHVASELGTLLAQSPGADLER